MEINNEPLSIEASLEKLEEDLSAADEFASDFGARTPLQDLSSFEELIGHETEMMAALAQHYGVDLKNPQVAKEYSMQGTDDSPGEGEIMVRVIATNNSQVFLGEYTYADGDIVWAIRPLDVEE